MIAAIPARVCADRPIPVTSGCALCSPFEGQALRVPSPRQNAFSALISASLRLRGEWTAPLLLFANLHVARRLGVLLVPLRGLCAVGHIEDAERYRDIHLGQIVVVQLLPFVAGLVVIGEDVADGYRGGRDAGVGEGGVVAAAEERVAIPLVLDHLH